MAADLEFFFDPVCPWAWITSRWVTEVKQIAQVRSELAIHLLKMINEHRTDDWYTPEYRAGHMAGLYGLRVADQVRLELRQRRCRQALHGARRVRSTARVAGWRSPTTRSPVLQGLLLKAADLPPGLADAALDESHDEYIRSETDLGFERTGKDVGTPIITFHPGQPDEASFFGPVIASIPRGEAALKLWDAIEIVATTSGMAELKRSNRSKPVFD